MTLTLILIGWAVFALAALPISLLAYWFKIWRR